MSAPVIYKTTDAEHTLPKLTPAHIVEIGERVYVRTRKRLLEDLDTVGASEGLRIKELNELDRRRGVGSVIVNYAFTVEGAIEIIRLSIEISGKDTSVESLDLDPSAGMFELAQKLIGVNWDELIGSDKDDLDADPTTRSRGTG